MRLDLPFDEALAFARSSGPLPDVIRAIGCDGSTITVEIDARAIESSSLAVRLALAAAGTVSLSLRPAGFADGVAELALTVSARGLPVHKLLPFLLGPVNEAIARAGLPDGLVAVAEGNDGNDPVVRLDLQRAIDTRVEGMTVTSLGLADSVIHLTADIGVFRTL